MYETCRSLVLLGIALGSLPAAGQSERLSVRLSAARLRQYGRLAITVSGVGDYRRPGDPADVRLDARLASPDGRTITVPGFAMHETRREKKGRQPKLVPTGPWIRRVRFMPGETGTYRGTVAVIDRNGARTSDPFSFSVVPSENKGVIRVAAKNPWAFEYEDGSPYIPIGQNLAWANGNRLEKYRQWLDRMAANNCNYIRVWLGAKWCFGVQGTEPYHYDEDAAGLMDAVLRLCEKRGIAIKLCLGNKPDTYFGNNGGPFRQCRTRMDFLTKQDARIQWKAFLRYCVARYGASTAIMAWELWNEMDHQFGHRCVAAIIPWTEEMCRYLTSIDPHNHLVTNSTGSATKQFDLYGQPAVDFTQYHDYGGGRYPGRAQYEIYAEPLRELRRIGKPVLLAECGLVKKDWGNHAATRPGKERDHPKDTKGYAFHEALWIGFFGGGAGTGMTWWWDSMVEQWDYYGQFAPFAKFVRDIRINRAPLPPADGTAAPEHLRCFVRRYAKGAVAWVVNRRDNWRNLVMKARKPETVTGGTLTLTDLDDGTYRTVFMDTRTGETTTRTVRVAGGTATLRLPDFQIDIAVKTGKAE